MSVSQAISSVLGLRFRAASRDALSDDRRLGLVRRSFEAAIEDAERERDGLKRRLKDAGEKAAFLFGPDIDSEAFQDAGATAELKQAEMALIEGQNRLVVLNTEIERLRRLKSLL